MHPPSCYCCHCLVRTGMGEQDLETEQDFSRVGRVNAMLARRLELLAQVGGGQPSSRAHTHTHTHARVHTCTHTHTHAHTHAHAHRHTCIHMHTCPPPHTHTLRLRRWPASLV